MKASDLILVNHKGDVIDGGPNRLLNKAAFMIHSAVHEARPEVACAAHAHSIYGRTFASLGRELEMITQDSCAFYKVLLIGCAACLVSRACMYVLTRGRSDM